MGNVRLLPRLPTTALAVVIHSFANFSRTILVGEDFCRTDLHCVTVKRNICVGVWYGVMQSDARDFWRVERVDVGCAEGAGGEADHGQSEGVHVQFARLELDWRGRGGSLRRVWCTRHRSVEPRC